MGKDLNKLLGYPNISGSGKVQQYKAQQRIDTYMASVDRIRKSGQQHDMKGENRRRSTLIIPNLLREHDKLQTN